MKNNFLKIIFLCLFEESWLTENTYQIKKNLTWFIVKCFSFIFHEKHFSEVVKKLKI
jgi:hypothetical protein